MFAFRVIVCAISVIAALAELIDETNIEICVQKTEGVEELTWDLEFEGYKS